MWLARLQDVDSRRARADRARTVLAVSANPAPAGQSIPPVPHADRQLLALHALRQRQLRTAFLHGRRRSWRDRRRIWPAVVFAVVLVAVLIAAVSLVAAVHREGNGAAAIGSSPGG
ncbi:MAG TPA: hypothetical protein VII33_19165, partial [Nakamurella sp.]